jgi:DNA-binding NtrC family response regulator
MAMLGVLIADKDTESRRQMAEIFINAGYNVMVTTSAANALLGILKRAAQVVLLGSEMEELAGVDLIPLLRRCNRKLSIILISDDVPLPLMRKARREGIFYHALRPMKDEDLEEIRQAVQCAFRSLEGERALPQGS